MSLFTDQSYFQSLFSDLVARSESIEDIEFQCCQFKNCKFNETNFYQCKFIECDFENCDLSLAKFKNCKFSESSFKQSNLAGINWTVIHWPTVKLTSPIYFYDCNLSHSSFYGLELSDLIVERCKVHHADFRETNLNHASFIESDLEGSLFVNTSLQNADFTDAIHYNIDIKQNNIAKARFSFPEVITLLKCYDIKIAGYDD